MSSDNGYVIRIHPKGGFAVVGYSMSCYMENQYKTTDGYPLAIDRDPQFDTIQAALDACESAYFMDDYYSEYGAHIDAECQTILKDLKSELHEERFRAGLRSKYCSCGYSAVDAYDLIKHQVSALREQIRQLS